jgi:hypothetical protein
VVDGEAGEGGGEGATAGAAPAGRCASMTGDGSIATTEQSVGS